MPSAGAPGPSSAWCVQGSAPLFPRCRSRSPTFPSTNLPLGVGLGWSASLRDPRGWVGFARWCPAPDPCPSSYPERPPRGAQASAEGSSTARPPWATIWGGGGVGKAEAAGGPSRHGALRAGHLADTLGSVPCPASVPGGGKGVFLVIFKCLEPLIETSEAMPPPIPPDTWECPSVGLGVLSEKTTHPASTCWAQTSHPVTQPHGEGDSSPGRGRAPASWTRDTRPPSGGQNTPQQEI